MFRFARRRQKSLRQRKSEDKIATSGQFFPETCFADRFELPGRLLDASTDLQVFVSEHSFCHFTKVILVPTIGHSLNALKRPTLFESSGKIVRPMRKKEKEVSERGENSVFFENFAENAKKFDNFAEIFRSERCKSM